MPLLRLGQSATQSNICRYGRSKLSFRGPARDLRGEYIACLGGSETFGQTVEKPFPELLEGLTAKKCVNLGWPNAGIDVFRKDPALSQIASGAVLTILQVPGAVNLTTRFYSVHPRRNDRVTGIYEPLFDLYPDVDFTQFSFTRHLLAHLRAVSQERFLQIQAELAAVWTQGMKQILSRIAGPVILLWFSDRAPGENGDDPGVLSDPSLVSAEMLGAISGHVASVVACPRGVDMTSRSPIQELADIFVSRRELKLRRALPDADMHEWAAQALLPDVLRLWKGPIKKAR
ncbi:MAG: DUF6473 family protein [Pseudomonadota bacterium]